ncbi:MAG: 4Fe-4S dicluster domain-containing protein [Marinifilaceae bacterium]|nr:4Fe-4S dicluster domain-containing protein [Marinifilaceae bacterium]
MVNFGFTISVTRAVEYDKNDKGCAEYVALRVPSSSACIGCGGCSATCTAGNLTEFNIRKIQMLMKRGENQLYKEQLHKCMLCGKCLTVCPRGVDTRGMILAMIEYMREK